MSTRTRDSLVLWLAAAVAVATTYAIAIAVTGGFSLQFGGLRLRSRAWGRPALLAFGGALVLAVVARARVAAICGRALRIAGTARFSQALAFVAIASAFAAGIAFGTFASGGADSYGYVGQARLLLQGRLTDTIVLREDFRWPDVERTLTPLGFRAGGTPGVIVPQYPPGLPLLLVPLAAISERAIYLLVPVFGAFLVWLTYRVGALLGDSTAGAMAAILLVSSPTFLYQVVQPMSDVPAAACWLAALLIAVRGTSHSAAAAGAIASLATLIRPNLAPLAGLIALGSILSGTTGRTRRACLFVVALAPGLAVLGWIQSVRYGSAFASGYGRFSDGFSMENVGPNFSRYPRWLTDTQTWFIWLSLASPLWIVRRARKPLLAWLAVALAAATWAAYLPYAYFQVHEWYYARFLLPALAVMLIFASAVALWILQPLRPGSKTLVMLVLMAGLVGTEIDYARARGAFAIRDQERKYPEAAAFVRDTLPANAFVLAAQHSGSIRYYAQRPTLRWDLLSPAHLDDALASLRASGYIPFLVVDASEYEAFRERFAAQRSLQRVTPRAVLGAARVFAFE
jgi:hypothetical protein